MLQVHRSLRAVHPEYADHSCFLIERQLSQVQPTGLSHRSAAVGLPPLARS